MPKPQRTPDQLFQTALAQIDAAHRRRTPEAFHGLDFTSNDYLGFARETLSISGSTGATGSRLLSGSHSQLHALESWLANWYGTETALVFPSAYQANLALVQSLVTAGGRVLVDKFIHASLLDALRLSEAPIERFRHNDLAHLKECLLRDESPPSFVLTESVFSIHGDRAPLPEMAALCEEHGAHLIVDEAHGCGWSGPQGKGLVEAAELSAAVPARVLGFGKAWGAQGGAILCSHAHRDWLLNRGRALIYSTAISPLFCEMLLARGHAVQTASDRREALNQNLAHWHEMTQRQAASPIQFIPVTSSEKALEVSNTLLEQGLRALPIRVPTAPGGQPGLRVNITSTHTQAQLEALTSALDLCLPEWNS